MRLQLLTALLAVSVALGLGPRSAATEPPPLSDVILARNVLAALDADAQLKGVNLVVSVVDRVAVIGGPVGNADLGRKAEKLVRGVGGIADVKNRCYVEAEPDPFLKAVAERLGSAPRPPTADLPALVPPLRTGTPAAVVPPPKADEEVVVARKPAAGPSGILGSPTGPAKTESLKPAAVLTGLPKGGDMLASAESIRKADWRFASLALEQRGGVLVIGGTAPRATDAWDFAESLRQVPGVTRVVVGDVRAK